MLDLVKRYDLYTFICLAVLITLSNPVFSGETSGDFGLDRFFIAPPDSLKRGDSTTLRYPFDDETVTPGSGKENPIYLKNPANIKTNVEYDPVTRQYYYTYKIGETVYRIPTTLSFDEFQNQDMQSMINQYWQERSEAATMDNAKGIIPKIHIPGKVFETIFGNNTVDIRPQGSAEIAFGIVSNRRDDPMLSTRQRRQTNFDFQEKIQMNVVAKIGDKIEFKINYNTEATFEFENKLKLKYEGKEDDIIQLIEAGDVNMPLSTNLIRGTESLFGIKTKLRFGRLTVTALYSQQKSETKNIVVQGNAQTQKFRIRADDYEENKHFFLAQNFRNNYRNGLKKLPIITSNVNILKIEVWVTNIGAAVTENRNIVAFMDLGEVNPYNTRLFTGNPYGKYPSNNSNNLFQVLMPTAADSAKMRNINTISYLAGPPFFMVAGEDVVKVESARKLLPSEYTFNPKLGFISLNSVLNSDQALAVAYQYTVIGDTAVHQVGEFSDQGISTPQALVVKLLKSTSLNTRVPTWNLMMKNVYALGAYQVQPTDFTINILYSGNANGVPTAYITEGRIKGVPLLRVLNFDNLNQQLNPPADGMFDFLDQAATQGGTIQASNGRVFFTVLEPFGKDLRDSIFDPANPKASLELADNYCFDSLYTMTKSNARQYPDKNKFVLDGFYKSAAGSEISLNAMNVPPGSVKVTAGGILLQENVHYTVDYTLGRVRIINDGILASGTPINISLESNEMFNVQTKRLMGAHLDYKINKDFVVGATVLNLNEQPLTQKVNYGDEPMSNTIWGMNLSYRTQSRLITRFVDALPLISTKAPSSVAVDVEFAQFIPGHSKSIGKTGTTYIDDFEGAKSTIDLKSMANWFMASTPQGQTTARMFPEASPGTGLAYGYNRAKLAWYIIDPLFYDKNTNLLPPNVSNQDLSNQYVRQVWETEIFPNKQPLNGVPVNLSVLNMAYYPENRGPYNFDIGPTAVSKGLNANGTLAYPETRWGGVMRKIETTDFDATNIQYIEFWMMDPFIYDSLNSGDLYFNLGDISEDILRDGRKSYENGLPTSALVTGVDTTIWGRVPQLQALVDAFDNTPESRPYQDVGYDGLSEIDELSFFDTSYVARVRNSFGESSVAFKNAAADPSADDYHYFRGNDYDNNPYYSSVLNRYLKFNGPDGNSATIGQAPNGESYPTMATSIPNIEDINKDNTLSESERYYQYVVHLRPDKMKVGINHIANVYHASDIPLANGTRGSVDWYQFKIPIRTPDQIVGNISGYNSIRFMRMFFKNFPQPVVCRFASLELSRGEWRKYNYSLLAPGEYIPTAEQNGTQFDIATVSIEEDGSKQPVPYVMPPGIERETNWGSTNNQKLNEQSMSFNVCDLVDGDARAAYKSTEFDFRQFKYLNMFVHANKMYRNENLKTGDLTIFMRIGSDFTENFYEYEIPLSFTEWGTQASNPDGIWPESNAFNIELDRLVQVKYDRLVALQDQGVQVSSTTPYSEFDGRNKITVVGSPTISDVRAIMIGVRNPKKSTQSSDDDGQSKCAQIWVDELRLTDFKKDGGFAATARVAVELADLGRIQLTGTYKSSGFGTLEQKQTERLLESVVTFGFDTDIELGKFFPAKSGIRIPMHFDYSMLRNIPKYDPFNPDLYLNTVVNAFNSQKQKDSIRQITQGYTQTKNFNLINVRKDRTGTKKPRIYDIENFNASYAYSEIFHRDADIAYDLKKKYTGGFGYTFSGQPKNVVPFRRVKVLGKSKAFTLIKDFNFYYLPKSFAFRTDMNREFNQRQFRNISQAIVPMETFYIKRWDWNRTFDLKYDFAKSFRITLVANTVAFVNEPPGQIDRSNRDQVWSEIFSAGTKNNYNQAVNFSWDVPIGKIPMLDFITLQAGYTANYRWSASPISIRQEYGNSIENGNIQSLNGGLNLVTLYNRIPYLKRINQASASTRGNKPEPPKNKNIDKQDSLKLLPTRPKIGKVILEGTLRFLMGIRNAKFTYTQGNGTSLPGFKPEPVALGNNWSENAPGLGFVFGAQSDIARTASEQGWLTRDTMLNTPYLKKFTENLNITVGIEPVRDLRIEVVANKQYSLSHQEYYKANSSGVFSSYSPLDQGSFSMSYIIISTAFAGDNSSGESPTFEKLKQYRLQIAQRYAASNPNSIGINDSTGFPNGYGPADQEVLTTAFLAAYAGKNPASIKLTAFPSIPLPNWRLTYDGLVKLKFFKTWLRTLTLTHAYLSTYNVGTFNSNILYHERNGMPAVSDDAGNFYPQAQLTVVSITEQFNPLIKLDLGFLNSLLASAEMRRSRNISLSFVNSQLTEITSNEFIVGLGYRIKGIRFNLSGVLGGAKKTRTNSDLNLKLDFSLRKNKTVLRGVVQNINLISVGQQVMTLNFSADYNLSARFNVRFYFDKIINTPYVSNQYRTSNTKGGIALRFTLGQ
ncbi:MAG: cell surface protein SprA [Bacteroidetes bacterium]|nr:cell surface protein SprA [Bacteroidota bacterium]